MPGPQKGEAKVGDTPIANLTPGSRSRQTQSATGGVRVLVVSVLAAVTAILFALYSGALPINGLSVLARHATLPSTPHLPCIPASFISIFTSPDHSSNPELQEKQITIENATFVPADGEAGEPEGANIPYATNPTALPPLCAVTVRVTSTETGSSYRFGVFLPEQWDQRLLVVGNGGWAGGIHWLDMAVGARSNMAALSTDTGHRSGTQDSSWARHNPVAKEAWGWQAMHGSVVLGKLLVTGYYTPSLRKLERTYYSGCSTGGRQGLKELQLFPDSFDGALIGAPAWWTTHLNTYITQVGLYQQLPEGGSQRLSQDDLALLAEEVVRQCDGVDGVVDGIVSSPESCKVDLTRLICSYGATEGCLNAAQIETARKVYNDWYLDHDDGKTGRELLYTGLTLSSEKQWILILNGTEPSPYGVGYARNFLFDDGDWDWRTFNVSVLREAERRDPGRPTADDFAAMARVRDRGGKIILYHGMADGLVPTRGTELFYHRTKETLAGGYGQNNSVDDFMRLFLVPGLQHCWGTAVDAPWNFGAAFQAGFMGSGVPPVPGFDDPKHNALKALIEWVERGKAVDSFVATTWKELRNANSGVRRQRPVCAWPKKAVWDGKGDVDAAASWRCSS